MLQLITSANSFAVKAVRLRTNTKIAQQSLLFCFSLRQHLVAPGRPRVHTMAASSNAVVMHVTTPDKKVASQLSSKLVEEKLAACVQTISGVESTYVWEGKVETEAEFLLLIKTQQALVEKVTSLVQSLHPYDVPEVIATPITGGSEKYLQWLKDTTKSD